MSKALHKERKKASFYDSQLKCLIRMESNLLGEYEITVICILSYVKRKVDADNLVIDMRDVMLREIKSSKIPEMVQSDL